MVANGQIVAVSPEQQLRERLADPGVAESLNRLLDHADLLAVLVDGLDGFVRRGDEISSSLSSAVDELRGPVGSLSARFSGFDELKSVDRQGLADSVSSLAAALVAAMPAMNKILQSPLMDPQAAEVLAGMGTALVDGKAAAEADPGGPKGLFGLWRVSKDKDISRGLGFLLQVARAFGRQLPHD